MTSGGADRIEIQLAHPRRVLDTAALSDLLRTVAEVEGVELRALSVVLSDHETVHALNRDYLHHDYVTDVLAFDLRDPPDAASIDGEIYVDLDTAAERHEEFGTSFEREAFRYAIHGMLHLAGYRDDTPEGKALMHRREDELLEGLSSTFANRNSRAS